MILNFDNMGSDEKHSVDLIITLRDNLNQHNLFNKYDITVLEELGNNKYLIDLPLRPYIGSTDIRGLQIEDGVLEVLWEDGSECCPIG